MYPPTPSLLCYSNTCSIVAETLPLEAIQDDRIADNQENQIPFSSPVSTTQLDTVPTVNPTTTPIVNPIDSPPAPVAIDSPPAPVAIDSPPAPAAVTTTPPMPPSTTTPSSSGGQWCIASPTASETALQVALDYACGYGGADCAAIQSGGSCYNPNTVRDHASYAFNSYYQKNPIPTSCVFGGTAQLTSTDPSNGNCHFAASSSTPSISSPVNPTPTPTIPTPTITTPTTMTPPMTTTPGGPTIFGVAEPTGLPSSATSISCSLLLLYSMTAIVGSLLAANHL
ncbi:hydrolase, hydrolyzing O-glycosyl compounds, putative [Ricinus communis]|uniref:Hydrolase, hydrolyzing O-glycosyl compounds, putative n=1 Tax=Ricinus communis TaxID=3988 RepID=B9S175_RICCO|nr:hydrolase, hydrolyzing O-glycosyl compounds, putative [Ricinus communis]